MRHSIWRASATDTGAVLSAISRASACAAASSSSGGWTLRTSPPASASSAAKTRPVATHSIAWLMPTMRGRNQLEHASGTMPRRANTKPIFAPSAARRMSIGSVIVMPTPTAGPLIAAITGLCDSKIRSVTRPPPSRGDVVAVASRSRQSNVVAAAARSAPAQNAAPRAGDDHGADVVVGVGASNASISSSIIVGGERVQPVGPVQRDRQDAVGDLVADVLSSTGCALTQIVLWTTLDHPRGPRRTHAREIPCRYDHFTALDPRTRIDRNRDASCSHRGREHGHHGHGPTTSANELDDLKWVVDAYTLALAAVVLTADSLADRFGRRRVFWPSASRCSPSTSAMAAAAYRHDDAQRDPRVPGLGAAAMFATSMRCSPTLPRAAQERAKALAVYGATIGGSFASARLSAGPLTTGIGGVDFDMNIPLGLFALAARRAGSESRGPAARA